MGYKLNGLLLFSKVCKPNSVHLFSATGLGSRGVPEVQTLRMAIQ